MNTLQRMYYTVEALGWQNVPRRVWQTVQTRLGISRWRLPGGELPAEALRRQFVDHYDPHEAAEHWQDRARRFFFKPDHRLDFVGALTAVTDERTWEQRVTRVVTELQRGHVLFFSRFYADLGIPPQFNRDPVHRIAWPTGRHWSTYVQFDPKLRDLKCVWEASRCSWAFYLARACVRTGDATLAARFWDLFDEWDRQNPYGLTPQWACGQESTFRMFAWLFCAATTLDAPAASVDRLQRMSERVWYTARHLERNINYARSQKNNHALSEAAGLFTIGLLFPELRRAATWRAKGRRVLETDLRRQTYADGSYVQHSLNYHRVMLDDLLWAARLGELHGEAFSDEALACLSRALDWLLQMIEPQSGRAPNYGANDGALVLPLSTCDYLDFRPVAQAVHYLIHRQRCFPPGPWDEKMLWLFGPESLAAPLRSVSRAVSFAATAGGYFTLKGPRTWGMIRCHSYRDRPLQADMLHLDLWCGATNVLRDAGSYHYYCEPPWQDYFHATRAHNTVEIDHADQMIKGPRFMWLRWTRARTNRFHTAGNDQLAYFEGEHYGYTRLPGRVIHRRAICRIDNLFLIVDDVLGTGVHEVSLRWRLCDTPWKAADGGWETTIDGMNFRLVIQAPKGFESHLLRGVEHPEPEGWESLYYAERCAVPVLRVSRQTALPVRLVTIAALADGVEKNLAVVPGTPATPLEVRGISAPDLAELIAEVSGGKVRFAELHR
jgi:hypothetical protein